MELGNLSVSLAVKDIEASRISYEKLGFTVFMGKQSQNWLIMKSGETAIGLFQGMLEENIITFNPGWNSGDQQLEKCTDGRALQRQLKEAWRQQAYFAKKERQWGHSLAGREAKAAHKYQDNPAMVAAQLAAFDRTVSRPSYARTGDDFDVEEGAENLMSIKRLELI